jgi:hypothetical protein
VLGSPGARITDTYFRILPSPSKSFPTISLHVHNDVAWVKYFVAVNEGEWLLH